MARQSEQTKRLQVLRDFYRYFKTIEPLAQQGVIDNLEIMRDLQAEERRKGAGKPAETEEQDSGENQ